MLRFLIFLFFMIYTSLEMCKYRIDIKHQRKVLKPVVVYSKLIFYVITLVLLLLNRVLPSGVLERSGSLSSAGVFSVIMVVFLYVCIQDVKTVRKDGKK